jgi:raffinose/stachyose/melibiose transport system substrate-binding protein
MELIDMGAINGDANAISRDEAEVPVLSGKTPMYYMGSWAAGSLNDSECADQGNFTYIPFPAVSGGNGSATEFNGGAVDCIMASADTANPDAAATFIKYFCENVSREGYLAGSYMPTWKIGAVDESGINPIMVSIKEATASASDFVMWWDTFLGPDLAAIYQDAMVEMMNKQITPAEFVERLKTINP